MNCGYGRSSCARLILAVATLGGILLATVTMGAHEFLYALQRFREGWSPPPAH